MGTVNTRRTGSTGPRSLAGCSAPSAAAKNRCEPKPKPSSPVSGVLGGSGDLEHSTRRVPATPARDLQVHRLRPSRSRRPSGLLRSLAQHALPRPGRRLLSAMQLVRRLDRPEPLPFVLTIGSTGWWEWGLTDSQRVRAPPSNRTSLEMWAGTGPADPGSRSTSTRRSRGSGAAPPKTRSPPRGST